MLNPSIIRTRILDSKPSTYRCQPFRFVPVICCLLIVGILSAQTPFVTTWQSDNTGVTDSNQIQIPGTGVDYSITWEEVGNSINNGAETGNGTTIVTFPSPGTYSVSITPGNGSFTRIRFNNQGDKNKITSVDQWGDIVWSSMVDAFLGCSLLDCGATDVPDLSGVTSLESMFQACSNLNGPMNIGSWNTQNVTVLAGMFSDASIFNQDIGGWNTQNVTDMTSLFHGASAFNQPIGEWNTSNVTSMYRLFADASTFDQPIGNWDTHNVTIMRSMFNKANSFNQPIENWNTEKVTSMYWMFNGASTFNQPIGAWDTHNVTDMGDMFYRATSFNQPLENWNTEKVTYMQWMFFEAKAFNQPLGNWNTSAVTNMRSMFREAISFNQDIGNWNTSNVTDMQSLFQGAISFNQPIGGWNTSSVTTMRDMFTNADAFNQPIGDWNTSSVTNMHSMFSQNDAFNQPIGDWNTSSVIDMGSMFCNATVFNQPLGDWNTSLVKGMSYTFCNAIAFNQNLSTWSLKSINVIQGFPLQSFNLKGMFEFSGMDCMNYDKTLIGWADDPDTPQDLELGADGLFFWNATDARNSLIQNKEWTFIGDAYDVCDYETSISTSENKREILLWPNPAKDWIQIHAEGISMGANLRLTDMTGQVLRHGLLSDGGMDLQGLPAGNYIFLLETADSKITRKVSVLP